MLLGVIIFVRRQCLGYVAGGGRRVGVGGWGWLMGVADGEGDILSIALFEPFFTLLLITQNS